MMQNAKHMKHFWHTPTCAHTKMIIVLIVSPLLELPQYFWSSVVIYFNFLFIHSFIKGEKKLTLIAKVFDNISYTREIYFPPNKLYFIILAYTEWKIITTNTI